MSEDDVCANMERLFELLDYLANEGRCVNREEELCRFLRYFSRTSLRVLTRAQEVRREQITEEVLIACFYAFERVGQPLMIAASWFNIPTNFIEVIETLNYCNISSSLLQNAHFSKFGKYLSRIKSNYSNALISVFFPGMARNFW